MNSFRGFLRHSLTNPLYLYVAIYLCMFHMRNLYALKMINFSSAKQKKTSKLKKNHYKNK